MRSIETNSSKTLQEYPCKYLFKTFGVADPAGEFAAAVHATINNVVPLEIDTLQCRLSSKGGYLCVTVAVNLDTEQQRQQIYSALQQLEGLKYLL